VAKPKKQKPNFDIGDLLGLLKQPKVAAGMNLAEGKITSQDVMGLAGGVQSKAAPYSGILAQAGNNKLKNDYELTKFLADFYTPASEAQRLVQGKSEKLDPMWAAVNFFPFAKTAKKLKNIDKETKMLLDVLRSSKPLRNHIAGSNSGSTDYTYSPLELFMMQLQGG